jgi:hypothetical protein
MATEWDGAPVVAAVNQRLVDADAAGRRPEGTLTHTEATKRFREFIRSYREDQHFVLRCVLAPATRIVLCIAFVVAVCRRGGLPCPAIRAVWLAFFAPSFFGMAAAGVVGAASCCWVRHPPLCLPACTANSALVTVVRVHARGRRALTRDYAMEG